MFFPYGDKNDSTRTPYVNYLLIAINILVFVTVNFRSDAVDIILQHAITPGEFSIPALFTYAFLHSGLLHIIGNLLFLHIYGDNVEDQFGHIGYLLFYLLSGAMAGFFHLATDSMPCVGASGAVAGVMGAYVVLFPVAKIKWIFILFPPIYKKFELYSWVTLGFWFMGNLLNHFSGVDQGVAFAAHIGGFITGAAISGLLVLANVVEIKTSGKKASKSVKKDKFVPPVAAPVDLEERHRLAKSQGHPCPACVKALKATSIDGFQIDQCFECGGLWLDKGQTEHLLRRADVPYSLLNPPARALDGVLVPHGQRKCAKCDSPLGIADIEGVQVEACAACGGLWLEKGELGDLRQRLGR